VVTLPFPLEKQLKIMSRRYKEVVSHACRIVSFSCVFKWNFCLAQFFQPTIRQVGAVSGFPFLTSLLYLKQNIKAPSGFYFLCPICTVPVKENWKRFISESLSGPYWRPPPPHWLMWNSVSWGRCSFSNNC
jgi:hypothetical protein